MPNPATVAVFTTTTNGTVPAPGTVTGKFLRDDATWAAVPAGATGPAGVAGPAGAAGAVGSTGAKGATGAAGSQGPAGATGPQGVPGATGPAGSGGNAVTGDYLINVRRDFGAKGTNAPGPDGDDTIALQNALYAAYPAGGKVYLPRGTYRISNSLLTPGGTYASIVLEGEGGFPGMSGSSIVGNFNDYLIKNGYAQTNNPNWAIINLGFEQDWRGGLGPDTEHTAGCINWGAGTGGYLLGCKFGVASGIAVYAQNDCIEIIGCQGTAQFNRYPGSNPGMPSLDSIGVWTTGKVSGGKWTGFGTGVVITDSGMVENIMVDTCNTGVSIGSAPMAWERNPSENGPGVIVPTGWAWISKSAHLRAVSHESCITGLYVGRGTKVFVEGGDIANYVTPPEGPIATAAVFIDDTCDRSRFERLNISGSYGSGGIILGSTWGGQGRAAGTRFIDVIVNNNAGPRWVYKTGDISTRVMGADSTGADPILFENCPWLDSAINVNQLPLSPSSDWLQIVKDSVDPLWTGSSSNVGKPVQGGGGQRAHVRWNGAGWVLAG